MPHPAVARLRELLSPPVSGGDAVDWAEIEKTAHLAFPADYREFVETYGGGEIDEYLSVALVRHDRAQQRSGTLGRVPVTGAQDQEQG